MSIYSINEHWQSRGSTVDWTRARRTYTRSWIVLTDDATDDAGAVRVAWTAATGITILSVYPTDVNALVKTINIQDVEQTVYGSKWMVTANYDSYFEYDPLTYVENPLLRPAIYKGTYEKYPKAVREDLNGDPIVNSAETPFDPPLELQNSIPIITVQHNIFPFDPLLLTDTQDCINSVAWSNYPKWTVLIRGVEWERKWENNVLYWQLTWTLAVKSGDTVGGPWRPTKVLDQGFYELIDDEQRIIRDKFGNPLPHPSMLDGEGGKLEVGGTPEYLNFVMHREIDFSAIPIPAIP